MLAILTFMPRFVLAQEQSADSSSQISPTSEVAAPEPVMDIKLVEGQGALYSMELKDVDMGDFFRVIAHDYNMNFLLDKDTSGKITASLRNIGLEEALNTIAEMNNLALEKKGSVIVVKPNLVTKVFFLKYMEAGGLLSSNSLAAAATAGAAPTQATGAATTTAPTTATAGTETAGAGTLTATSALPQEATIYDPLSERGKVLLGKQPNSLMVIDFPPNVAKVEEFIAAVDQKRNMQVFKLKYLSVKDIFPNLASTEREERQIQRTERQSERDELKELQTSTQD